METSTPGKTKASDDFLKEEKGKGKVDLVIPSILPVSEPKRNAPTLRSRSTPHWHPHQEHFSFRRRKNYDAITARDYFCPRPNYRHFLTQLDEVLLIEKQLNQERTKLDIAIGQIYRGQGMEPPAAEEDLFIRHKYYHQVLSAYYEIRKRIRKDPLIHESENFNHLIASLEIVGAIIMNPFILASIGFHYGDEELKGSPWIYTSLFATDWTHKIIGKISFPTNQAGICFHSSKEVVTQLCHDGDN